MPQCQERKNVLAPKINDVMTVSLSRRRSRAVPPDSVVEPPNMSESPLPRPECRRMNTIRKSEEATFRTSAMMLSTAVGF